MSRTISIRRLVGLAAPFALAAAGWWFLAPPQLGGRTDYVFTDGISMQPRFHTGDLAIVRRAGAYHVGQIVAYHNDELRSVVLHRIVAIRGGRYFFKGDNNNFVDPDHPTRDRLVGALWLHVPHAYAYLSRLHSPLAIAVLVAVSLLFSLGGVTTRRRRRRKREGRPPPRHVRVRVPAALSDLIDVTAAATVPAAAALLAVALAVTAVAFTRPVVTSSATAISYTQAGTFSYSGRARPGVAYPDGLLHSGEPVFLKLVRGLDVRFVYRFSSRARTRIAGTVALNARLSSDSGWSRTYALTSPQAFSGKTATVTGVFDVGRLPALLASLEQTTSVSDSYTLTVTPDVRIRGLLDGSPLHATYSTGLPLTVQDADLLPQRGLGSANPFHGSNTASISRTKLAPATVSVHGFEASVDTLRGGGLMGTAGSLALLLVASGTMLTRGRRRDETSRIKARYGPLIVDVARNESGVVELEDMDALARLAEQYERPILHGVGEDGRDEFGFTDDGTRYVYRTPPPPAEPEPEAPVVEEEPEELTVQEWMDRLGMTAAAVTPPPRRWRRQKAA